MNPNTTDQYSILLRDISSQILQSRYRAARLVNRELLLLYFAVGRQLSEKITAEKWGAKVVEQLSADLQKQLPGLRGFSNRNLKNMRQFADVYSAVPIGQLLTAQLKYADNQDITIDIVTLDLFLSVSFTHHILLLNRCSDWNERWFYMQKAVTNQWTVETLDWQINAKSYQKRDQTLPNNFASTLPETIRDTALQALRMNICLTLLTSKQTTSELLRKVLCKTYASSS